MDKKVSIDGYNAGYEAGYERGVRSGMSIGAGRVVGFMEVAFEKLADVKDGEGQKPEDVLRFAIECFEEDMDRVLRVRPEDLDADGWSSN